MKTFVRAILILVIGVLPSMLVAQADSLGAAGDSVGTKAAAVFATPVGIRADPSTDTATHARKEYHGLRWTVIGAVAGGLITGGASGYLIGVCETGGDCRGAWRWVVIATGAGAIVGGFLTGLVYGLFNG